jgi:hypothetical protein
LLDRAAIGLSMLCLVHCLALPVLLVLIPPLAALPFAGESFHLILVFMVLPTSIVALFLGCRRHRDWSVLALGSCGVGVLLVAALLGPGLLGEGGEKLVTVIGSILVAVSHVLNFRLCRSHECAV